MTSPPAVAETLRRLANDPVEMEQFLDFLINRKFRQSVLCHDAIALNRAPRPEDMARFSVAARPQAPPRPTSFSDERLTRAALECLVAIWPRALPFAALVAAARSRLDAGPEHDAAGAGGDARVLSADLLRGYHANVVELHTHVPPFVLEIGECPVPSPLARLQAAAGSTVMNLRHEAGQLSDFGRYLLRHLDGCHDRAAILESSVGMVRAGRLAVPQLEALTGGGPFPSDERVRAVLGPMLEQTLTRLARFALLVG